MPFDVTPDETTVTLKIARSFIERGWCRHAYARDAEGNMLKDPLSPTAVSWCANGALAAAGAFSLTGPVGDYFDLPAVRRLAREMSGNIATFNNSQSSVEPVLAAFDRAIAAG